MNADRATQPGKTPPNWWRRFVLVILLIAGLVATVFSPRNADAATDRSVEWSRFDVTLILNPDGSYRVTEQQVARFQGGPFRGGYRDIDTAHIETVSLARVSELRGDAVVPYREVTAADFDRTRPDTFFTEARGPGFHIEWSFPASTDLTRTFIVTYDVDGALRVYPDATPPYQQISWIAVGAALTGVAPVREASLTMVLPRAVEPAMTQFMPGTSADDLTSDGKMWRWTASDLGPGEQLAAGLRFPPLVAADPPAWQSASDREEANARSVRPIGTMPRVLALAPVVLLHLTGLIP